MRWARRDVVQAGGDDVDDRLRALTDGRGPDVAFEAVGIPSTVAMAIASVRKGGTVVLVGNVTPAAELPLQWVVSRQLTLAGSAASCGEYPQALELIASRRIDVGRLLSEVAPLADGAAWFARLRRARHGAPEGRAPALTRRGDCTEPRGGTAARAARTAVRCARRGARGRRAPRPGSFASPSA